MPPDPHAPTSTAETGELLAMTSEILAESGGLACPSLTGLVEFLIDRGPGDPTGAGA